MEATNTLLDALYAALPIVEDAESDPGYKSGYVAKVTKQIRGAIAKGESQAAKTQLPSNRQHGE